MLKIRRPLARLIFNMGIAIPGKTVFLIETAPSTLSNGNHRVSLHSYWHTILPIVPPLWEKVRLIYVFSVSFPMPSYDLFTHISQGCFTGDGASHDCHNASKVTLTNLGKITWYKTTTKRKNARTLRPIIGYTILDLMLFSHLHVFHFAPEASFDFRVLSFAASVCVCMYVCVSVCVCACVCVCVARWWWCPCVCLPIPCLSVR